jgi:RNA polymerase sigma-70 factor (ECF subfamily)
MKQDHSNIEDQLLVMDAQDGDSQAMEKLVTRWQKRLWQHAYRLTDDAQASWDITQQTWLGIIKGLRKLHDPAKFKAWAYRITTNKAMDWIKKSKYQTSISIEEIQEQGYKESEDVGIKQLLHKLDTRKRVVLSLYYFEELNISQISAALRIPKGTVKSRLANARNELKELWQKYGQ